MKHAQAQGKDADARNKTPPPSARSSSSTAAVKDYCVFPSRRHASRSPNRPSRPERSGAVSSAVGPHGPVKRLSDTMSRRSSTKKSSLSPSRSANTHNNFAQLCSEVKVAGGGRRPVKEKLAPSVSAPARTIPCESRSDSIQSTTITQIKKVTQQQPQHQRSPSMDDVKAQEPMIRKEDGVTHACSRGGEQKEATVACLKRGEKRKITGRREKRQPYTPADRCVERKSQSESEFATTHVVKWADMSEKFGVAFLLRDNSITVCFKDYTKIVVQNITASKFLYMEKSHVSRTYSMDAIPVELLKKVRLLFTTFRILLFFPSREHKCGVSRLPCTDSNGVESAIPTAANNTASNASRSTSTSFKSKVLTKIYSTPFSSRPRPEAQSKKQQKQEHEEQPQPSHPERQGQTSVQQLRGHQKGTSDLPKPYPPECRQMSEKKVIPASPQNAWRKRRAEMIYVMKWSSDEKCTMFKLSNRTGVQVQLIFHNGAELFYSQMTNRITFVSSDAKKKCVTCDLDDVTHGDDEMQQCCKYVREVVRKLTPK